jgi:hypothetical protein
MQQAEVKPKAENKWQEKDLVFCTRTGGFLDATGYVKIDRDAMIMVRTTFCSGVLAWEPLLQ